MTIHIPEVTGECHTLFSGRVYFPRVTPVLGSSPSGDHFQCASLRSDTVSRLTALWCLDRRSKTEGRRSETERAGRPAEDKCHQRQGGEEQRGAEEPDQGDQRLPDP